MHNYNICIKFILSLCRKKIFLNGCLLISLYIQDRILYQDMGLFTMMSRIFLNFQDPVFVCIALSPFE